MFRVKVLVGAIAFSVAAAVPGWFVPVSDADAMPPTAASGPPGNGGMSMSAGSSTSDGGSGATDWQAMDAAMAKRDKSFPAATKGTGGQLIKPTVLPDGTKEFHLTTEVTKWEVEPGKFVEAWTYNGMVPGPTFHVNVGDKVRIVVRNNLPESTSTHWHGLQVPNDQDGVSDITQDPIKPGSTYTYAFTATRQMVG